MATIFTFLSDQYQHELKQNAEGCADRFETVMSNYKKIFWDDFAALNPVSTCTDLNSKIAHLNPTDKQNLQNWLDCFQQTLTASSTSLQTFFDDLIDIYDTFIKGNLTSSSQKFNKLLTTHNLFNSVENFEKYYPITFRGRTNNKYSGCNPFKLIAAYIESLKESIPKTPDYFYHIPFDKLHFIKNYRFSLTGQPFIYLGASIPTVLLELRSDLSDYKRMELSSWGIKPNQQLKMYDISNSLYDLINLNIIPIFQSGSGLTCQDTHVVPNATTFVTDFRKFIISQFCTFKKEDFDGQVFIEQYVIPKLLTEQIRNYQLIKYDGFVFPSTQYLDRASAIDTEIYYGLFKNNIALFLHYSLTDNHDNTLISKFEVTTIDKTKSLAANDYVYECGKIMHSNGSKTLIQVKLLKEYYEKMKLDNTILTELNAIKLQFSAMLNYIKQL